MVDLGRQTETILKTPGNEKKAPGLDPALKILWENDLLAIFESRYLTRYIFDHLMQNAPKKRDAVLQAVKEKSAQLTQELLNT